MRLVLDSEQEQLRSSVRDLLTDHAPSAAVRAAMEGDEGYDRALWRRLAGDLGAAGLVVGERHGGAGAGHVERAVVQQELGRVPAPVPYLASAVLAVDAVQALGDESVSAELLPGLATGERIGAVAAAGADGTWGGAATSVTAEHRGGGWSLTGRVAPVLAGDLADVLLVLAGTTGGARWFVVDGGAEGLARTALVGLDPTRRMARLDFAGTPARAVDGAGSTEVLERVRDLAVVALAAEQLGVVERVLADTTDYATARVQFGRAIGSYQAVKHRLADVLCTREQATALVRYAAWTADHDPDRLAEAAALAQVHLAPACFQAAADGVQLKGGIGYTWEDDAHLLYKRAKSAEVLFGTPGQARDRLADRLGF